MKTFVLLAACCVLAVATSPRDLQSEFDAAASRGYKLMQTVDSDTKLYLYARFKQAKLGDCNIKRGSSKLEQAKWDAWNGVKGMSKHTAQQEYIDMAAATPSDAGRLAVSVTACALCTAALLARA